jgi:nicotinamidase-related amidase
VSHVVILIIDMQVDFFAHDLLTRLRPALVANVNALVAAARVAGSRIIWVRQEFSPDLADAPLEVRKNRIRVVVSGTPGASFLPELNVVESDEFIVKKRYSAFFGTDLDERLSRLSCRQIIVAGVNTHACVRSTVIDAYQRDFPVLLATDCVASYDKEHHDISWRYMDGKLGRGMTNSELFGYLRAHGDDV